MAELSAPEDETELSQRLENALAALQTREARFNNIHVHFRDSIAFAIGVLDHYKETALAKLLIPHLKRFEVLCIEIWENNDLLLQDMIALTDTIATIYKENIAEIDELNRLVSEQYRTCGRSREQIHNRYLTDSQ